MRAVAVVLALALAAGCGSDSDGESAARTTVQLRPLLGEAERCQALDENPPPDKPVSLTLDGRCVGLAPSVLTIKRAAVQEERETQSGSVFAHLRLPRADADKLADVSRQFLGETVAVVAFGRVVVAPRFLEEVTEGDLQITGLTSQEIAELKTALAP